jgi:hypothetical protein
MLQGKLVLGVIKVWGVRVIYVMGFREYKVYSG